MISVELASFLLHILCIDKKRDSLVLKALRICEDAPRHTKYGHERVLWNM
jgi:hypothetical protein